MRQKAANIIPLLVLQNKQFYQICQICFCRRQLLPPENEVWGKVIFSEACVKNSVHGEGSASVRAGIPPPWTRHHPLGPAPQDQAPPHWTKHPTGPSTPLDQATPLGPDPLSPWTRHPPCAVHAGRYGQQMGSTHPTGMHSCLLK